MAPPEAALGRQLSKRLSRTYSKKLSTVQWSQVLVVAGIGTILEWFDFYIYTQLSPQITAVFFPKADPLAQQLSFWGIFAAGFVVRPLGGLIFGHVGDTVSRNRALLVGIICMAVPTLLIGILPGYSTPDNYHIGVAAPILLVLLRVIQGLAIGGEYGTATVYISELAPVEHRGLCLTALQSTASIGLTAALVFVMVLTAVLNEQQMLLFGWRIPFFCAALSGILGAFLRTGLPEPHARAVSMRVEQLSMRVKDPEDHDPEGKGGDEKGEVPAELKDLQKDDGEDGEGEEDLTYGEKEEGALTRFRKNVYNKVPVLRVIHNDWLGIVLQVCLMAWISGAYYTAVSWNTINLTTGLKALGYAPATALLYARLVQLVSYVALMGSLLAAGFAIDKGLRVITYNLIVVLVGAGSGFGFYYGFGKSLAMDFVLQFLLMIILGQGVAMVGFPMTRVFNPLERASAFGFGYNLGFGVFGGLSPLVITAIQSALEGSNASDAIFAPGFWLLALAGLSFVGSFGMQLYLPRLDKPFIGKIL